MVHNRILLFLLGAILVPTATVIVILFARGFRPDFRQGRLQSTGLLAATSVPDGAQIYLNGNLKSATNTTLNLPSGEYFVEIKKAGFKTWNKKLRIEPEIVTRTGAVLFPSVSSFKAVSSNGADQPVLSPDGSKVFFVSKSELYILDLTESPLGIISRDPKLVPGLKPQGVTLSWTPDSKQILAMATTSANLIDIASQQSIDVSVSLPELKKQWTEAQTKQELEKMAMLPKLMQDILASGAANLVWSPRENKILYTATASAIIPDNLIRQLPGSNSQPQARTVYPNISYVYDLEEDRNFKIPYPQEVLKWFPDSNHLLVVNKGKVHIIEYDGSNDTEVYTGPMANNIVYPYPSGKQLLILTNLSSTTPPLNNLYAVSLR